MGTARASLIGVVLLAGVGAAAPASAFSVPTLHEDVTRPVPMPLARPMGPPPVPLPRVRPELPGPVPMPHVGDGAAGLPLVPGRSPLGPTGAPLGPAPAPAPPLRGAVPAQLR